MGVYQKYKDENGKSTGPWFVTYPYKKNQATGEIKYKIEKVGSSKKLAQRIYGRKYEEYKKREQFEWDEEKSWTFNALVDWYLDLPDVKARVYYNDVVRYCKKWKEFFGDIFVDDIKPSMVEEYRKKETSQPNILSREIPQQTEGDQCKRQQGGVCLEKDLQPRHQGRSRSKKPLMEGGKAS
jgi:hypothetical protein